MQAQGVDAVGRQGTDRLTASAYFRSVDHTGSGRALLAAAGVGLLGGFAVLVRDPHLPGALGTCPVYLATGLYCPGCGALRGTHDLLTGQWAEAIGHNQLLLPAFAWVLWWFVASVLRLRGVPASRFPSSPSSVASTGLLLLTIVAFMIARNYPGSPLAP
jgi:hypothetical protein